MSASVGRAGRHPSGATGRIRATLVAILAAVALVLPVSAEAVSYPGSMASTGDSITRAYNTGFFPYSDNPAGSWSTGTNTTVNSHYRRLLALNPAIQGKNYNHARSGAKMVELDGQLTAVAARNVDYVTVLMGGNDVCTSSPATMTSVADFSSQFSLAMDHFSRDSPNTRVFVASIPRVLRLWSTLKNNGTARLVWSLFGVCQSMLRNPQSTAAADVARREAVDQREQAFNAVLESVCEAHPHCLFDGYATFNYPFVAADISTRDYFHPSLTGQKNLAAGTWAVSFWGP